MGEYNLKKKVEHNYKAKLLGKDPYALSAVNSVVYGDRFINFVLKEVFESNDPHIQPSTFAQRAGLMNTAQKQVHIAYPTKQKSLGESNKFIPNDEIHLRRRIHLLLVFRRG